MDDRRMSIDYEPTPQTGAPAGWVVILAGVAVAVIAACLFGLAIAAAGGA